MISLVEGVYFVSLRYTFFKAALSIVSSRLVETLYPSDVFIFPSGFMGTFINSLQLSSWML